MIDPKIKTLLILLSLGNYTKTARLLSLTQPAVSHQIKALEEEYGINIFHKNQRKLSPTPEGEILIKYARRIVALEERARQEILDVAKEISKFNVGITTTLAEYLVSQIFATYCNQNPGVHINIVTDTINNIYNKLSDYQLDWAIVEGKIPETDYTSLLLDTDYLCLVVSPQHHLAKRKSVSLTELKEERFILRSPAAGTRLLFESHLRSRSEDISNFNIIIEIDSIRTIKELVASSLGATIITHSAIKEEVNQGQLVIIPIENLNMVREINMVHHRDFKHTRILKDIMKIYNSQRK